MDDFRWIFLAILGVLGVGLVFLLRRGARAAVPREELVAVRQPTPVPIEAPAESQTHSTPAFANFASEKIDEPPPVSAPAARPASIDKVLALLKDKDALATAFVLSEIMAPPVSKRT